MLIESIRAQLDWWDGDAESARRRAASARAHFSELGLTDAEGVCMELQADIAKYLDDPAEMLRLYEELDQRVRESDALRSTTQARIAEAHLLLGHRAEALAAVEESDSLSAEEDVLNFAATHAVRARLALAEGDAEAAERWARSAVEFAFRTDFARIRGEALLELAQVLRELGRPREAAIEARRARDVHARKGFLPGLAAAESVLRELDAQV
jgi:tetratricopeptide (TPR) repeat protein